MGMYNEVFARCPQCDSYNEIQIGQVVLGFGGFYLDDPETMKQLSPSERRDLAEYVNEKSFHCVLCEESYFVEVSVNLNRAPKRYVI